MLEVVYCCNDKLFDGLYLSILSIVRRSKEDYRFTILTADLQDINKSYAKLSDYHAQLIEKMVKEFNSNNIIRVCDVTEQYKKVFSRATNVSIEPYENIKMLIPDYFQNDKVLYIDVDVMANNDIKVIYDFDVAGTELYATHIKQDNSVFDQKTNTHFSTSVLLINSSQAKSTNLFDRAIKYYLNSDKNDVCTALNSTSSKIKFFPNEEDFNYESNGIKSSTILKHFVDVNLGVNIKPWDYFGVIKILELHNWDSDYKYFLEHKKSWVVPKQIYNILYSCNDGIFDGLYLSILSMLRRSKETFNFFIMTADLSCINPKYQPISSYHVQILRELIKSFNNKNTLTIIDCSDQYLKSFGSTYDVDKFTAYTLLRLFADEIKELDGLALYIDVDTLINGDIKEAWNTNMHCTEMCVCHDYWLINNKKSNIPMFNAGVLLINVDFIKITKYFKKCIDFLVKYKPPMADQQALYNTWYRIKIWDDEFRFNFQQLGIQNNTIIKHFNAADSNCVNSRIIKPWEIEKVQNILNLHNWDDDFKFFLNQKKIKKF